MSAVRFAKMHQHIIIPAVMTAGIATYPIRSETAALVRGIIGVNHETNCIPNIGGRGLLENYISSTAAAGQELPYYLKLTKSVNREFFAAGHKLSLPTANKLIENLERNGSNQIYGTSPSITHAGELSTFIGDTVREGINANNVTGMVAHLFATFATAPLDSVRTAPDNPFSGT